MTQVKEGQIIVGIETKGKDPIIEKLDIVIEAQEAQQDLLEDILERLTDLELPTEVTTAYD